MIICTICDGFWKEDNGKSFVKLAGREREERKKGHSE